MTDEDILDALQDINNILDGYTQRVGTLEFNSPQKTSYFIQFLKSIEKSERCIGGIVLPTEGECDCSTTPDPGVPIISCVGATNKSIINMHSFLNSGGEITVKVNDQSEVFSNKEDFDNRFNEVFDLPTLGVSDFHEIYAYGSINYRVSITVTGTAFTTPIQISDEGGSNPTFMFEGKTISFCLATGE